MFISATTALAVAALVSTASPATNPAGQDPLPRKPALGAQFQQGTTTVQGVLPGLSAEGTLKAGDQILKMDGATVASPAEITQALSKRVSGETMTLLIKRDGQETEVKMLLKERPREVSPDYDVLYEHVVSNGKRIRVIITKPKKAGKFPVFMVMQGLGAFSMDYAISGQSGPYIDFIKPFATRDFVTLRVEKPGMGDAEGGPYNDTDFLTEGDVYLQALRHIKKQPYARADRTFIFGHSMGGTFGPWVVSQEPVFGFIPASTIYKTWTEYWLENIRRQLLLGGASRAEVQERIKSTAVIHSLVMQEGVAPSEVAERYPQFKEEIAAEFPQGDRYQGRTLGFWRQLAQLNYPALWDKVDARTLVMWGQWDFVSTEEDHWMIRDHLNARKPGSATYVRIDNADHGFRTTTGWQESYRSMMTGTFNNNAVKTMSDWIDQQLADADKQN